MRENRPSRTNWASLGWTNVRGDVSGKLKESSIYYGYFMTSNDQALYILWGCPYISMGASCPHGYNGPHYD